MYGRNESGDLILVDRDQCVRPDTSMEALAALKPAFLPPGLGTVTAGNSSPLNDGAAALLVMSDEKAEVARLEAAGRVSWQQQSWASSRQ